MQRRAKWGGWGISPNASEIEKIKSDLNDFIYGLNSTCKIDYATYSMLFDYINPLIQKAYYLGQDVDTIWEYMILDDAQDGLPDTEVETPDEALVYVIDCTLATVFNLSLLKNPPKNELKRQIGIAQKGINFMSRFDIDFSGTKAEEITETVQEWSDEIREREFGIPELR